MKTVHLLTCIVLLLGACAQTPSSDEVGGVETDELASARVHTELATAYYGAGRFDVALEEVRIALEARDDYLPAVNQLGLIYLALGRTDDAERELRRAIRIDPDDPSVNNNYGLLLCSIGKSADAMRYFEKTLQDPLYQTPELAYVNAGLCMKRVGNYARAEEFLRRAVALAPDQPNALYHLADIEFMNGNLQSARSFITRHLQLVNSGPDALWLAARVEKRLGDEVALNAYGAQLNRRFPDSPQTRAFNQGRF
jgi:type IV pilus assembly protein PilF